MSNYFFPLRTFLCGGDTQALPQPSTQWPDTKSDECRTTAIGIYVSTDRALCALGETDPHMNNKMKMFRSRTTPRSCPAVSLMHKHLTVLAEETNEGLIRGTIAEVAGCSFAC